MDESLPITTDGETILDDNGGRASSVAIVAIAAGLMCIGSPDETDR